MQKQYDWSGCWTGLAIEDLHPAYVDGTIRRLAMCVARRGSDR